MGKCQFPQAHRCKQTRGWGCFFSRKNSNQKIEQKKKKNPPVSLTTSNAYTDFMFFMCILFESQKALQFWSSINNVLFFFCPRICQTGIENAAPRWGKNSKLVLVSLLLAGLLLAALLVAGYYLKTHRKNSKGVRLVSVEETMLLPPLPKIWSGKKIWMCLRKYAFNEKGAKIWTDSVVPCTTYSTNGSQTWAQIPRPLLVMWYNQKCIF